MHYSDAFQMIDSCMHGKAAEYMAKHTGNKSVQTSIVSMNIAAMRSSISKPIWHRMSMQSPREADVLHMLAW
jgi:hypothetical protein